MGSCDLLAGEVVYLGADALGQATRIGEEDRRIVGFDLVQEPGIDGRPDRFLPLLVRVERVGVGRFVHVLHRDDDLDVQVPVGGDVHDRHGSRRPRLLFENASAEEPGDRLERSLRGR